MKTKFKTTTRKKTWHM